MKISEQWLREWVDPAISSADLEAQLTMSGLEVEGVEDAAPPLEQVVVGRVTSLRPHPDADKLRVARVDVGQPEALEIVCGAPNVVEGGCFPTALIGATLPGGLTIKAAKLRGVDSEGMLCSARELGLSEEGGGLMMLPADSPVGKTLMEALALDDRIFEIALTPNRSDCLSVAGIAREVGVLNRHDLTPVKIDPVAPAIDDTFPVVLSDPADCPRYVGRVIRGLDPDAQTPVWMQERLRRSGLRSLGPLVDVTNYVMLELGQPLHAFDLHRLSGKIDVRRARPGEQLELLNGQLVELGDDVLLITDDSGPLALAGIMGGEQSGVADDTCDIFLESAFFSPTSIAGRARRFGLHTDASHRFERGVDPGLQAIAVERATRLFLDISGGEAGPLVDTREDAHLPASPTIRLRQSRINLLLGAEIPAAEVTEILQRLELAVTEGDGEWQVTPPGFRFDLTIETDLIEEVGRIYGYDRLPGKLPDGQLSMAGRAEAELSLQQLRNVLVQRGYQEAITYSFVDPEHQRLLEPDLVPVALANPIASDLSVMRTNLWPGLLKALGYNQKRQQSRVRLFESGLNFRPRGGDVIQDAYLAAVACGEVNPQQWGEPARAMDFFDLKGDVEALLALTGSDDWTFRAAEHPALHPGQTARVERAGEPVGWLGALHPRIARALDLDGDIYLMEIRVDALTRSRVPWLKELSKFPASRRDLAVVVPENVTVEQVLACVREHGGERLREVTLFDVYRGKGIPEGAKNLAFSLILQDFSANLTDETVEQITSKIIAGLESGLGATLRV